MWNRVIILRAIAGNQVCKLKSLGIVRLTLLSTTKTTLVIPDPFHLSRRPVNLAFCLKLEEKILATL
jgi:hypothetical protein